MNQPVQMSTISRDGGSSLVPGKDRDPDPSVQDMIRRDAQSAQPVLTTSITNFSSMMIATIDKYLAGKAIAP